MKLLFLLPILFTSSLCFSASVSFFKEGEVLLYAITALSALLTYMFVFWHHKKFPSVTFFVFLAATSYICSGFTYQYFYHQSVSTNDVLGLLIAGFGLILIARGDKAWKEKTVAKESE